MTTATTRNELKASESKAMRQAAEAAEAAETVAQDAEAEELEAAILAQLETAYADAINQEGIEAVGPTRWWDVMAIGPFSQPFDLGFPKPNPIVRVGQLVRVVSVLFLNPIMPPPAPPLPSPLQILGGALLPYQLNWDTTNVSNCTHEAALSGSLTGTLSAVPFHINVITLRPRAPGLCELNLRAQILNAASGTMVPFAGYASRVDSINASIFGPDGLTIRFEQPVRFDVYA